MRLIILKSRTIRFCKIQELLILTQPLKAAKVAWCRLKSTKSALREKYGHLISKSNRWTLTKVRSSWLESEDKRWIMTKKKIS